MSIDHIKTNRILIVDDNHINRQYFSMTLKKYGFSVSTAEDGIQAIQKAQLLNYDAIIMDIRMPEMDGYETTRKIHALENHKNTPIFATSAESIDPLLKHLFQDFLLKPISPKVLVETVTKVIDANNSNTLAILDEKIALNYAYQDKEIMLKLIDLFLNELPILISQLTADLNNNNFKNAKEIIHKLRGSSKTCGAIQFDNCMENLSHAIDSNSESAIINSTNELYKSVDIFLKKVKSIKDK